MIRIQNNSSSRLVHEIRRGDFVVDLSGRIEMVVANTAFGRSSSSFWTIITKSGRQLTKDHVKQLHFADDVDFCLGDQEVANGENRWQKG